MVREHQFYVTVCKFIFAHKTHGIVSLIDPLPLEEAKVLGLEQILLYGVTVAGLPLRWVTFSAFDERLDLLAVLQDAWAIGAGLRGKPDRLCVSRHLATAAPLLASRLAACGVELVVAGPTEKSLPAVMNAAQGAVRWYPDGRFGAGTVRSIADLRRAAIADHELEIRHLSSASSLDVRARAADWLALPVRPSIADSGESVDWKPGSWCWSWQATAPVGLERCFMSFDGTRTNLMTGNVRQWADDEDDDEEAQVYDGWENPNDAELIKDILSCWPNSVGEVAAASGYRVKELEWLQRRKFSEVDLRRVRLRQLLGIDRNPDHGDLELAGPCVLVARKGTSLEGVYVSHTGGGDASPFELLPERGLADPSFRYFLMNGFGSAPVLVMAGRGDPIEAEIPKRLFNFTGSVAVRESFYRDVVATCARACRSTEVNVSEAEAFQERNEALLDRFRWNGDV